MSLRLRHLLALTAALVPTANAATANPKAVTPAFQTSDRCIACHNELRTASGKDVSIGFDWRSSIMANSSRDPYWQASSRRETIDHPAVSSHIQDECSVCHMPVTRYEAKLHGQDGTIFDHLPLGQPPGRQKKEDKAASDGVDCSICHQIGPENLGTKESFNGGFVIDPSESPGVHPEYGPYDIDKGQQRIMQTSTGGYQPNKNTDHLQKSELCATCHTLITTAFKDGQKVGSLPEQMPYKEWLNSDFKTKQTCQDCHMPAVNEPAPITRVFGVMRDGMKQHVFVGANFFMQRMLNQYRDDLDVEALPQELNAAADNTVSYLKEKAARVSIENLQLGPGRFQADVLVENLGGHKLPSAFPSRRAWLHVTLRDAGNRILFESGALRPDGSITGNDNDADPSRFEPHYREISNGEQVQIYEDIIGDTEGHVTTGLLQGVRLLKDNRLLPKGFDKQAADPDIAVRGAAADDPNFTGAGNRVRFSLNPGNAAGPLRFEVELMYQPIGYRWANNLKPYSQAPEPRRFTGFFDSMSQASAQILASAAVTR